MSKFPQEELLSAYLDGELSAIERAEVEKLLADDASAKAMLEELRGVSSALKGLDALKLDEDLGVRVLKIAERRMLADTPAPGTTSPASLKPTPSLKPTTEPFWRTVRRRFLTPRAIAWSATVAAVAILLAVYAPEEEKHGPKSPIAMDMPIARDMKADRDAPADRLEADDESIADGRARRGPGEFRAAPPPVEEESTSIVAKKDFKKAAPAIIAEKPAMKRPDAARHLAEKSRPYTKAMPRKGGPGMGMGGGMGGRTPLADKDGAGGLKRKSGQIAPPSKNAKAGRRAFSFKRETPIITVNCYYVSSPSAAKKALQKILLAQKLPSDKSQAESIAIEATPARLRRVLAAIRKQPDVFRDYSVDTGSLRLDFGMKQIASAPEGSPAPTGPPPKAIQQSQPATEPMSQQDRPARKINAQSALPPASGENVNYRVVFVMKPGKSQPPAASDVSKPAKK